ncbi:MAG: ribosome recycling factor [Halobacteriovoraceae bacterium]|nr:ribosome recycling factor [Halobacteriovoraceae bacterium]|tara:strand:- start:262462 stop:263019 length:558 start_codon:yes stop_codon:yes gene_type:complete
MMDQIKSTLDEQMTKAIKSLQREFTRVRTGRANANILDGVTVDYYGSPTPVNQVGQVSTPEARLLQIQPFDKTILGDIEKAIINANLGVTPSNDGNFIRIQFPALTEEKRKDLVREVRKMGEDAKIAIRNARRDQNEVVKKAEKNKEITEDDLKKFQDEIQKITDKYVGDVDSTVEAKEKELLTV